MSRVKEQNDQAVVNIRLEELHPSPTQPRQTFNEAALDELAASMSAQGVHQPLLVRLRDDAAHGDGAGGYEVVDGERRLRAAKIARIEELPCLVKKLSDAEVIEIQVIQAIQREGLAPLEEAQAYKRLMKNHQLDVPELAARVGKTPSYIFHRFKLLDLAPAVQEAVAAGTLKLSYAEAFARVPDHDRQLQVLEEVMKEYGSVVGNFEDLVSLIEERYLLQLKNAPFDGKDADLVPERPACAACPERTMAQVDLFGDAGQIDTCLNSACWAKKCDATKEKLVAKAEAKGVQVLQGSKAAKVLKGLTHNPYTSKYAEPSDRPHWLKEGNLGQALKGTDLKPMQVFDPTEGKVKSVYDLAAAKEAIPAKLRTKEAQEAKPQNKEEREKQQRDMKIQQAMRHLAEGVVMKALYQKVVKSGLPVPGLQALIQVALESAWGYEAPLAAALGQKTLDVKKAAAAGPKEALAVLMVTILQVNSNGHEDPLYAQVLKAAGVDIKPMLKQAQADAVAQVEAEEKAAAKGGDSEAAKAKAAGVEVMGDGDMDNESGDGEDDFEDEPTEKPKKGTAKKSGKKK